MMDRYLAQCADEAFKALLTDEDLETRLNTAAMHLGIPNDSQVDTASQDVRSALADVRSNRNDPCPNRASAIEQILREFAVERSRSEVAIAADFPKAVKQEKELKDKTVKKILVSDTDAAIRTPTFSSLKAMTLLRTKCRWSSRWFQVTRLGGTRKIP